MERNNLHRGGATALPAGRSQESVLATNKVLRNTYLLLSMTLLFSAATAGVSMALNLPHPGLIITLVGYFGLLYLTHKFRNSAMGILAVFGLTGFMGITLGPLLSMYVESIPNGGQLIMTALGATGAIFVGLSTVALTTKKDMSGMGNFLMVGTIGVFVVSMLGLFFDFSAFQMVISAVWIVVSSGWILWQTSEIIHGGETNYISATVMLYVSLYNIFVNLLMILGLGGND
jgi:modulator of FtsH protease